MGVWTELFSSCLDFCLGQQTVNMEYNRIVGHLLVSMASREV